MWYYRFMRSTILQGMRMNALKLAAIFLISVIFLISFGLVVGAGGMGAEHGAMIGCPFMEGNQALCPMAAIEHLAAWQELAGSMPERFAIIALLSMLITFFVLLIVKERERWRRHSIRLGPYQALYERNFPDRGLFVFVKELFSQGILNPKIFVAYVA